MSIEFTFFLAHYKSICLNVTMKITFKFGGILLNLEFNIAVHVLTFLSKHSYEKFNSTELSEKVCVNPVQLRKVMSRLLENNYIIAEKGKYGGYIVRDNALDISLGELFRLFTVNKAFGRIYTGTKDSECEISNGMSRVMSEYHHKELKILEAFYQNRSIRDILNKILMEE